MAEGGYQTAASVLTCTDRDLTTAKTGNFGFCTVDFGGFVRQKSGETDIYP